MKTTKQYAGIYNYHITKSIKNSFFEIYPRTEDSDKLEEWLADREFYHLTALVTFADDNKSFDLEAILSFVEQKNVIVTNSTVSVENENEAFGLLHAKFYGYYVDTGGNGLFMRDTFEPSSRADFIEKAFSRLNQSQTGLDDAFRKAIFKVSEVYKTSRPFIDVNYYLLFSALESLAKERMKKTKCSALEVLPEYLQELGFNVKKENTTDLKCSMRTYTELRNALFHDGQLDTEYKNKESDTIVQLRLTDYYVHFKLLVQLAIIKETGFSDNFINWDVWRHLNRRIN